MLCAARPRLSALAMLLGLGACSSRATVELGFEDDELAIIATVDERGRVLYADKLLEGSTSFAAPPDAQLFVWILERTALVGPDGAPLEAAALQDLGVAVRDSAEFGDDGACGRCLVPSDAAPQVFQSGDDCPVPSFGTLRTYRVSGELETSSVTADRVALVRSQVRIVVSGACACDAQIPDGATDYDLDVCGILPVDSPFDFNSGSFAIDEAGWFGAFAIRTSLIIGPDGQQYVDQESEPFAGAARGAVALATSSVSEGGRFLVFSRRLRTKLIADSRADLFEVVDGRIRRTPAVIDVDEAISVEAAQTIIPGRLALLMGDVNEGISRVPSIAELTIDGEELRFVRQTVSMGDCTRSPSVVTLRAAMLTESGVGMAIAYGDSNVDNPGEVFIRVPGATEWRCAGSFPRNYTGNGTEGYLYELFQVGTINDRIILVARGVRAGANEIVGFTLDPTALLTANDVDDWVPTLETTTPYRTNARVTTLAQVPGTILWRGVADQSRLIDLFGGAIANRPLVTDLDGFSSVTQSPRGYFTSESGWEVVRAGSIEAFYRRPPGGEAERIFGPSRELSSHPSLHAEGFGDYAGVFFNSRRPVMAIEDRSDLQGCTRFVPHELPMAPPIDTSELLVSATALGEARYLLALRESRAPETFILRWVDLDRGVVEGDLRVPSVGKVQLEAFGVLLNDQTYLLADKAARIFALSDPNRSEGRSADELIQLETIWDDPNTDRAESEPDWSGSSPGYLSISAAGGVAWVGGYNLLTRVVPGRAGEPPRAEGYWRWRADEGGFGEYPAFPGARPALVSMHAFCSDRVSFVANWTSDNLGGPQDSVAAWKIAPWRECELDDREDLGVCDHAIYRAGASRFTSAGGPAVGLYATRTGIYDLVQSGFLFSAAEYLAITYGGIESVQDSSERLWFRQGFERVGAVAPRR